MSSKNSSSENFPEGGDTTSAQSQRPSLKGEPSQGAPASRSPRARSKPPKPFDSKRKRPLHSSSVQLSDSLDAESAAIEAEFAQNVEEEGEGLGALELDLDELRAPSVPQEPAAYDDNQTRVAVLAKLAIIEGPDAKKNVPFVGIRMVLGRAPNLEVSLTDLAVSRKHAEFVRGDNGVLLRDLGSGNGTLVNGQRVTEQILAHNDVITVGATKLRYINESEAHIAPEATSIKREPKKPEATKVASTKPASAKPEEARLALRDKKKAAEDEPGKALVRKEPSSPPAKREGRALLSRRGKFKEGFQKKKRLILIAASAGVLLILLVAVLSPRKENGPVIPEPVSHPVSAESYMSQAREAVRQERYEEALALLEQAKTINPNIDSSNLGGQIELEWDAQKRLREVEALAGRKEFNLAKETLAKIPEVSARSADEKKKLLERIVREEHQFYLERAEELLMLGDFDAAMDAARLLPRVQQVSIGDRIEIGRASYHEAERQEKEKIKQSSMSAAAVRAQARKQEIALAFAEVQRKFNGEDWKRAADECDRVIVQHAGDAEIRKRAKELQKYIPEFGQAYDEGAKKYRAGQIAAAAKPLTKARALYSKIGFLSTTVDGALRDMLSQAALLAGEDTLARGDYAAAAAHFKEALGLQPASERAQRGLARVIEKAEDLFGMGYSLKASNPQEALRYFKLIVEISPRGSMWSEKAKNQINAMSPH